MRFGKKELIATAVGVAVMLLVFGGGALLRHVARVRAANRPFVSRVDLFYDDVLDYWKSLPGGDKAERFRRRFEKTYGDLPEYHELMYIYVDTGKKWAKEKKSDEKHPGKQEPDHVMIARKLAPNDAGVRFLAASWMRGHHIADDDAKDDSDLSFLREMRKITAMEPNNGTYHLWRAEAAMMFGESKESLAELKKCVNSPYFRTPRWWPFDRVMRDTPKKLTIAQLANIEYLLWHDYVQNYVDLKDLYRNLLVGTNIGMPISTLNSALKSACAMGSDDKGDFFESLVGLAVVEILRDYARDECYAKLAPQESAGLKRFCADVTEADDTVRAFYGRETSTKEAGVRINRKLIEDGVKSGGDDEITLVWTVRTMGNVAPDIVRPIPWFLRWKADIDGSEIWEVTVSNFWGKEMKPILSKIAAFDFEHPERYGTKDERK